MADFFISYTSADKAWAEWIAYVLEEEGFSVILQAWDFRPGSNFVLEMQTASTEANRTIMVLSPQYMKSQFASPEWAAALSQDPRELKRALVPVVVRPAQITGLLTAVVQISLVDADEAAARKLLIDGVSDQRAKPSQRPSFPGIANRRPHKSFPGTPQSDQEKTPSSAYMPSMRRALSDAEKRRFAKQAFETINAHFQKALDQLGQRIGTIECDFQPNTATDFSAEIFLNGKSICRCRVWQGGMSSSDAIYYVEGSGHYGGNSYNEMLSLVDNGQEFHLSSLLGLGFGHIKKMFDLKQMTQQQAADYLWRRFVATLER